jgi:hypothetical protein
MVQIIIWKIEWIVMVKFKYVILEWVVMIKQNVTCDIWIICNRRIYYVIFKYVIIGIRKLPRWKDIVTWYK